MVKNELEMNANIKQVLDEVFVISVVIKVEVSVISRNRRLRLITLTEILIISDITPSHVLTLDIALGNHALRPQPTDHPLISE